MKKIYGALKPDTHGAVIVQVSHCKAELERKFPGFKVKEVEPLPSEHGWRVKRGRDISKVGVLIAALCIAFAGVARADDINARCYARVVNQLHGPIADLLLPAHSNEAGTQLAVVFTDEKDVPLTDIKVHYDFTDAFGTVVDSLDGVWSGSFAPGVEIDYTRKGLLWERPLANSDHVKGINCAVTGARWADGSVFNGDTQ